MPTNGFEIQMSAGPISGIVSFNVFTTRDGKTVSHVGSFATHGEAVARIKELAAKPLAFDAFGNPLGVAGGAR